MACGKHTVSTDSIVLLQLRRIRNTYRITNLIYSRKSGGCVSSTHSTAPYPKGTSYGDAGASPSGRSTQSAWKQCGARHARLNRVTRTIARRFAQSTSEWPKTLPLGIQGAANRGPAKAQRSGFGGERRSSGTTELLPRKAKRRMWSLRRRGTPFSPIFRRATKDRATGGRQ